MSFNTILTAYDGSVLSQAALKKALELLGSNPQATLHVVHVFQIPQIVIGEAVFTASASSSLADMDEAEKTLEQAKKIGGESDQISYALLQGDPVRQVIDYARNKQANLIVVGSRGLGTLQELFLGSVSHGILQQSEVPVLVMKTPV